MAYLPMLAHRHQYGGAGCRGHQDKLGLSSSSLSLGWWWWLKSSMVSYGRCCKSAYSCCCRLCHQHWEWWCWPPPPSTPRVVVGISIMPTAAIAVVNAEVARSSSLSLPLRLVAISIVSGRVNDVVRRYLPGVGLMTTARCRRRWQCGGWHGLRKKWPKKNFSVVICHHNTPEFFKVPPDA